MEYEYRSPFDDKYGSNEMREIFSDANKYRIWRKLWVALARAQMQLGVRCITMNQVADMDANIDNINMDVIREYEERFKHDVVANIHAFADVCPSARPIIHLGCTSSFVTDNSELIMMFGALRIVKEKLRRLIASISVKSDEYKHMAAIGYTHLQPAQITTVGRRMVVWANDLLMDLDKISNIIYNYKLRGVKGAVGNQASFLTLFDGDYDKVEALDQMVVRWMGFTDKMDITTQTYTRKIDHTILSALSGIAQSASKFANDLRLLQSMREMSEPFENSQVGSSAMPYKMNPMRCERICALARYVMTNELNSSMTASVQWLERTLDDSANRRIVLSETFMAVDAILDIYINVFDNIYINKEEIDRRLEEHIPHAVSENLMIYAVLYGADRQRVHEILRDTLTHAKNSKFIITMVMGRLKEEKIFTKDQMRHIQSMMFDNLVGTSVRQVDKFNGIARSKIGKIDDSKIDFIR